jgi:hypothetical protein
MDLASSKKSAESKDEGIFSALRDSKLYKKATGQPLSGKLTLNCTLLILIGSKEQDQDPQDINLDALDVIPVDFSDDSNENVQGIIQNPDIDKLPIFDYLPDEVVLNIFERMSEQGV